MLPFHETARIVHDPEKGRCLEATRKIIPGELLWTETAFVFASCEDSEEYVEHDRRMWQAIGKKNTKKKNKKKAISHSKACELLDSLAGLPSVGSLDTARCLLYLILKALKTRDSSLSSASELFLQLEPSNIDDCLRDISDFRASFPGYFPDDLSTAIIGRCLGVLNNNQMELEDLVGSGLFVATAILEHHCRPNCSFSTAGPVLYMVATERVEVGDRLSIDYGNNFCRPTFYRQIYLYKTYKFFCLCSKCMGPDETRCFHCPTCSSGAVYALYPDDISAAQRKVINSVNEGIDPDIADLSEFYSLSKCDVCQANPPADYSVSAAREEREMFESGIVQKQVFDSSDCTSLVEEIATICSKNKGLMNRHFLFFWAVDKVSQYCSESAAAGFCKYSYAVERAVEVSTLLDVCLPSLHHEKVVVYDKIGQLAIAGGDISTATTYFGKALNMSTLVCGGDNPSTLILQRLATNTPRTVDELQQYYGSPEVEMWTDSEEAVG